ncbi:MAG: tRNA preQ1(34) S-adenosylmethionine ribosyltransferase-isomerase QueA [Actinobacteria bacterium RBG_16_64_13]|nr:MAG: tRNA preQ1(34) S-adenosylmethionine ribosyltransferase-isomerase QueA [Actinobacteria bacterium RBG_16_64_13]
MRLEELDFAIPRELIAQQPVEPRDSCRLMHLAEGGERRHLVFADLPRLLGRGDTVVFNDSRVLQARVQAQKPSGGAVELLFLRPGADADGTLGTKRPESECWEVLARPSHRLRSGGELLLPGGERLQLLAHLGEGRWLVIAPPGCSLVETMEAYGRLPLPPYIKTYPDEPSAYQTVYASVLGSAAAPTAGLHFTPHLLHSLREAGVKAAYVTLHVGLDTFQPIREAVVEEHRIHRETYSVSSENLNIVREALGSDGRLVAVGTTAARVLETLAQKGVPTAHVEGPITGSTDIFITPGHRFRAVDVLLTNLHLPRSSVLALTMAFAGAERLREAYAEAIAMRYRFFSFGDAMLIEGGGREHP